MASTTRTYLASDWQVWTYKPVAGNFRLDFSALNGTDVLGAVGDVGGMAVLDLNIAGINIQDGERPNQSVFGIVSPGTATITATYYGWSNDLVKELYPGKSIAITLKNQSAHDVDVYGRNSVFFEGTISSSNYSVDPINEVTAFNIECEDILSNALNQSVEVIRSTSATKSSSIFAAIDGNPQLFAPHLNISPDIDLTANFESNTTESRSLGTWLEDFIQTYVAIPINRWQINLSDELEREVLLQALHTQPTSGTQITGSDITNIVLATDGADIPTSFNLSNSTLSYNYAPTINSVLTLPLNYTATLDVNGSTQIQQVATRISSYTSELSPVEITVKTATTYQDITFDSTHPHAHGIKYWPTTWYANGTDIDIYVDFFATAGITPHYYTKIVGQSHEITPDYWHTTYQLLKGR